MLEKLSPAVGRALHRVHAGSDHLIWARESVQAPETIIVTSSAFDEGAQIPSRFTADGSGVSPPLEWKGVPAEARAVVVVVEDADSPTPIPILHLVAWDLGAVDMALPEGALASPISSGTLGRLGMNSFRKPQWLPPDPPRGHGPHTYVFQVYALDNNLDFADSPEKHDLLDALGGRVLARGRLTGVYGRPG